MDITLGCFEVAVVHILLYYVDRNIEFRQQRAECVSGDVECEVLKVKLHYLMYDFKATVYSLCRDAWEDGVTVFGAVFVEYREHLAIK